MDLHRDRSKITGCRLAIASWTGAWMRSTVARSSSPSSVITTARLSVLREVVTFEVIGAFPLLRGKPRRRRPNRLPRQVFGSRLGDYPGAAPENPESGSRARPIPEPGPAHGLVKGVVGSGLGGTLRGGVASTCASAVRNDSIASPLVENTRILRSTAVRDSIFLTCEPATMVIGSPTSANA